MCTLSICNLVPYLGSSQKLFEIVLFVIFNHNGYILGVLGLFFIKSLFQNWTVGYSIT